MSVEKLKTKVIRSSCYDPWYNMAVEEYLLNHVSENEVILYLWQVETTVMIGKHQNPWKECRCRELEEDGGKLARRISGGGAVFQDLGTLMFTFILDRELYDLEKQLQTVLSAVKQFGVNAEFSGRNDLTVGGKKFSGSAFSFKAKSALHHGTLLINTDLTKLSRYLKVSKEKIASKGVDSVQARVSNLSSINPDITINAMIKSLEESFKAFYDGEVEEIQVDRTLEEIEELYQKHASWEWRYGETPDFDISFRNRFAWGEIEIGLTVEEGLITKAVIYSDALDCGLVEELSAALQGHPFRKDAIMNRIGRIAAGAPERKAFIEDITGWLYTKAI